MLKGARGLMLVRNGAPLLLLVATAAADESIAVEPAIIPDTAVPAVTCVQPTMPDMAKATSKQLKTFQADVNAYGDCMHKYIEERHAKGRIYVSLQKAEVDAGNAAVQTVNAYFAQVRELQDKQRAEAAKDSK